MPGTRSPRAAGPVGVETLLRQLIAGQAEQGAQLRALDDRVGEVSKDAREARDLGNRVATKLEEQDIVARLDGAKVELGQRVDALRVDVVAANTLLKKEITAEAEARERLEARVAKLETARDQVVGVASFFGWLSKVSPWLFAGIAAFAAGVGLKDKLP